ncbi:MAG: YncE family protein, partial [Chitinophagales bacterium]
MKILFTAAACLSLAISHAQLPGKADQSDQILLPNGWKLSPTGRSLPLGPLSDLPLNIQISASGRLMAVTNNGESTQSVQLLDPQSETILDEKTVGKSWYGLAFSPDEKDLYASGGYDNWILDYPVDNNKLGTADTIRLGEPWPKQKICPTGMVADKKNLYTVTKGDSALYIISKKVVVKKVILPGAAYACLLSPNKKTLYISLWLNASVLVYDVKSGRITNTLKTGTHPNELLLDKKGRRLFVANANDNTVSVIDTRSGNTMETISATLYPSHLAGSTTNGLALSADEKTLY